MWGRRLTHRDRTVDVFVRKIRDKLESLAPAHTFVQTRYGVGYKLEAVAKYRGRVDAPADAFRIAGPMSVIADHMSRELLRAAPDEPIAEAARHMVARGRRRRARHGRRPPRRDPHRARHPQGRRRGAHARTPASGDWMTKNPETIEASDTTDHAAALMIHGGFRHLPVLDGGVVAGIISIRDLMRVTLDDSAPRGVYAADTDLHATFTGP